MASMGRILLSVGLVNVCLACITIESLNSGSGGLRQGGNLADPAAAGCNRIGCGKYKTGERLKMAAEDMVSLQTKLHTIWEGGQIKYEIKYGSNPDFDLTPGFEIEADYPHYVASNSPASGVWVKNFELNALYNGDATIQVSYVTDGVEVQGDDLDAGLTWSNFDNPKSIFHQCIDIEVTEGAAAFPATEGAKGIGPQEKADIDFANAGGQVLNPPGANPFVPVLIVLLVLIFLFCGLAAWLFHQKHQTKPVPQSEPIVKKAPEAMPQPPQPPKEKTPTPTPEEEEDAVGVVHYEDADEPAPKLEATGSMGRHFHFRYVNEGEDAAV